MQTTPYEAVIEQIVEWTPDTRSLFLGISTDEHLAFKPGQFLSFRLPGDAKTLTRAYTIASNPEDAGPLEICLDLVPDGQGSQYLFTRRVGDSLSFTGPWGAFVLEQAPQAESAFVAVGTGIVAIRPMLQRALNCSPQLPLHLLYGTRREEDLLYRAEIEKWGKECSVFTWNYILGEPVSDSAENLSGVSKVQDSLLEQVERRYVQQDKNRTRHFYICGIGQSVLELRDLLRKAGYERRAVKYEKW